VNKKEEIKVLIGCPTFGIDPDPRRWLNSLMTTVNDLHRSGARTSFCFPYRHRIHEADNQIIKTALMNGFTHILRMDDDIWGVQKGDVLKLLEADKEFISAIMYISGFPYAKCAVRRKPGVKLTLPEIEKEEGDFYDEVSGEGVQPVDLTATPFTLWKTSLFQKIRYPFFDPAIAGSPDGVFCQKCLDAKIQPFVHMDIQLNHREVTPWNRLYLYNSEIRRMLFLKQVDPTKPGYKELVEEFGEDGQKDMMMLKGRMVK
jgi:hypothetical protein